MHGRGPWLVAVCLCLLAGLPAARADGLDLTHRKVVFDETFRNLSVSPSGPGTTWIAHTPWNGDFGDAAFVNPRPGFPFAVRDGVFQIELRKTAAGKWESGLLASQDPNGVGFSQLYGYFEMRAKLPAGPGVWPAFWLDSMTPKGSLDPSVEIDVIEQYGKFPFAYNSTVTVWPKPGQPGAQSAMNVNKVPEGSMSAGFHTYGAEVGPQWIVFYFDRHEMWRTPTPAAHTHPMMLLVDLGLGSGWPIDQTRSPSFLSIDYIRVWAP